MGFERLPAVRRRSEIACLAVVLGLGCGGGGAAPADAGIGGASGSAGNQAGSGGGGAAGSGVNGGAGAPPAPLAGTVLADGEDQPICIAIDAANVYWVTVDKVRRVPKAGGAVATVYGPQRGPYDLQVDDTHLYWSQQPSDDREVVRGPKSGSGPIGRVGPVGPNGLGGIILDADSVFWLKYDGNLSVMRAPKADAAAPVTLAAQISPGPLSLDDRYVYWAESSSPFVQRVAKTGGAVEEIINEVGISDLPIPDATDIYFVSYQFQRARIVKTPKGGGGPVTVLAGDLDLVAQLALADDAVYVLVRFDLVSPGYIARVPKTGGGATKLVTDTVNPHSMAVDAQYVYWVEPGRDGQRDGRIRKIAR